MSLLRHWVRVPFGARDKDGSRIHHYHHRLVWFPRTLIKGGLSGASRVSSCSKRLIWASYCSLLTTCSLIKASKANMQMQSMKWSHFQYLVWISVSDQPVTSLASDELGLQTEKKARCWTMYFSPLGNFAVLILVGNLLCSVSKRQWEPVTELRPETIQQDLHLFFCKVYSGEKYFPHGLNGGNFFPLAFDP